MHDATRISCSTNPFDRSGFCSPGRFQSQVLLLEAGTQRRIPAPSNPERDRAFIQIARTERAGRFAPASRTPQPLRRRNPVPG